MELFVYLCTFNVKSNQLMKNLFLLLILSTSIVSCKKDHVCECDYRNYDKIVFPINNSSKTFSKRMCNKFMEYPFEYKNCEIK